MDKYSLTPEELENVDETNCITWGDIRRAYAKAQVAKVLRCLSELSDTEVLKAVKPWWEEGSERSSDEKL